MQSEMVGLVTRVSIALQAMFIVSNFFYDGAVRLNHNSNNDHCHLPRGITVSGGLFGLLRLYRCVMTRCYKTKLHNIPTTEEEIYCKNDIGMEY